MFVRNGAVTPGPSRESDITFFVKGQQNLRDNRVTVQWRRAGCRASPYRHPGCHANVVPPGFGKSQRVKTQRAKTSETSRKKKMFAEDISEDFSEDRRYHFYWFLEYFWISSKSSRKIAFF